MHSVRAVLQRDGAAKNGFQLIAGVKKTEKLALSILRVILGDGEMGEYTLNIQTGKRGNITENFFRVTPIAAVDAGAAHAGFQFEMICI